MAAPKLYKCKTATFKAKAIVHAQTVEIASQGTEGMARGDGAAAMQLAWVDGVHLRVTVTALESAISDDDLILPGNGSLVCVLFEQAAGSGATAGADETYTFSNATLIGTSRGAPLDGQPTVSLNFVVVAASGDPADLFAVT